MKFRKFLLVLSLVALLAVLCAFSVSAEAEEILLDPNFFDAECTEGCPRAAYVPNLFDGDITSGGLYGGERPVWYGRCPSCFGDNALEGDAITITFKQEMVITKMEYYVTGNWTKATVEFLDSKGEIIHIVTGDSYDSRIVADINHSGPEGACKTIFQTGDADKLGESLEVLTGVKQIRIYRACSKWHDKPNPNEHYRTLTISEIKIYGLHEHNFSTEGDYIEYPTCALDGLVKSFCFCGAEGEKVVAASGNHRSFERIVFRNGFTEPGYKTMVCLTCDTQDQLDYAGKIDIGPLFSTLGYSVREDGKSGVQLGISPNFENIEFYNSIASSPLQFGTISGSRNVLAEGNPLSIDENGDIAAVSDKLVLKSYTDLGFSIISCKISGFSSDFYDTQLILSAYVYDGINIFYLGNETSKTLSTVSYNGLLGVEPSDGIVADVPKE